MENKRILYISQEIHPYLPENDISRASLALPKKMNELGHQVRVFMPRFGVINERRHQLHEVIRLSGINIVVNDIDMPLIIKVASVPQARMQVYFIDNDEYFKRKATIYDENRQLFDDNDERTIFFAKGVIETVKKLGWKPDIIHMHGWMTSLVPLYLKQFSHDDPLFENAKLVFSSYNTPFKGNLGENMKAGLEFDEFPEDKMKWLDKPSFVDLNKAAADHVDAVVKGTETLDEDLEAHIKSKDIVYFDGSGLVNNPEDIMNVYREILVEEESIA